MNGRRMSRSLALVIVAALPVAAQQTKSAPPPTFDRRVVPPAGKDPELIVPTWTKTTLANGATLVVSERHSLPLVSVRVNFVGGANQYEPANKTGVATFTASQMLEGTTHRTGDQISNDMQLLGVASGPPSIAGESGNIALSATREKLPAALDILADVIVNPTFPQDALERYRARTLINLTQARDRTSSIAAVVFPKVLYGTDHPYGRSMTEATAKAITRADIVAFHKAYFQPGHAIVTVVGDIKPDDAKRMFDRAFANWKSGGSMPAFNYPAAPAPKQTTIFLVDKPGAASSTFTLGHVGPPRSTKDYYAIRVMNELLGGLFQSRLNHNIREEKGYSYGVGSGFAFGRGPGPFRAGGDIMTAKNDSALVEFMKELKDIRGGRPPSDDELAQAKASLVQSLPASFEPVAGLNGNIASIYLQGLPEDYYQQFARAVNAVTRDDFVRVAREYIDPDKMSIVIVGDRAKIEAPLAALKIGPIVRLDLEGNPLPNKVTP
jgi:predicted Zn-dependent peptidase